jgi:hypothetical protein
MKPQFEYAGPQTGWVRFVDGNAVPVARWNEGDVGAWLKHVGLGDLVEEFRKLNIDGPTLLNLTPDDVQNLGLTVCPCMKWVCCRCVGTRVRVFSSLSHLTTIPSHHTTRPTSKTRH